MLEFEQHCCTAVPSCVVATSRRCSNGAPEMGLAQSEMVCFAHLVCVLTSSACCSTLLWTEWLNFWRLEAEIKVLTDLVFGEGLFPGFLLCPPHMTERSSSRLSLPLLLRAWIPSWRGGGGCPLSWPHLNLITSQRRCFPKPSYQEIEFQHTDLVER